MPAPALRYCAQPGCSERVTGGRCKAHQPLRHREVDRKRGTSSQRGYDAGWQKFRRMYLAAHPFCLDCAAEHSMSMATDIHHVHKLAAGGAKFELSNLMPLCAMHHSRRTSKGE